MSKVWKKKCPNFLYTLYKAGRKSDSNATSFFIHSLNRFFLKKCLRIAGFLQLGALYANIRHGSRKEYNQWKKVLQVSTELGGLGVFWNPNRGFWWQSTLTKFSGFKEDLDWLKTDFNYCSRLQPKKLMWIEVHIYSVKAKSQAGNIWMTNIWWQHKKTKTARYSASDPKNLCILPENSAEGIRSRRECCWSYIVSVFENTP